MTSPIRVLIADDHPIVREGLAALVNRQRDMTVVAEARTGQEAVAQFLAQRPDVGLMDLRMPGMGGAEAIQAIRQRLPSARLIVLTTYDDDQDIQQAFRAGARAYLLKDSPREQLIECVRVVHAGRMLIPPAIADRLADHLGTPELTPRETEVLRLVADGQPNKAIAVALSITIGTVKTHVSSLLRKLDAADRTQAVTIALKRGILHLD